MSGKGEEPLSPAEARAIAVRYLGRREYGCAELSRKLERRGVDRHTAVEVVERLNSQGLVSDARFTEVFIRNRVARLHGPLKIRADLLRRGIPDSIVEAVLDEYREQWGEAALEWIGKRSVGPLDRKAKARLYRSAKSRGFPHEIIMQALDRLCRHS